MNEADKIETTLTELGAAIQKLAEEFINNPKDPRWAFRPDQAGMQQARMIVAEINKARKGGAQ